MKIALAVIGGGALFLGSGIALSQGTVTSEGDIGRGAKAWAENCASCHNLRGPNELTDTQWFVAASHMRVRANLPGNVIDDIIAFLQSSNEQPRASFIRETDDGPAPDSAGEVAVAPISAAAAATTAGPDRARGAQIYANTCVACHGQSGKGNLPGVPDLTAPGGRLTKSDEVLLLNMKNGFQSPGSPMAMPAKGGNPSLTDEEMVDVLTYIRSEFGK